MAHSLWSEMDCAAWDAALLAYPGAIAAQGDPKLAEVDAWYREDLPALIRNRQPLSITLAELVRLTEWKMRRGVWRARNLVLVKGNSEADVVAASQEAFAAAPDPLKPLRRLSELAGVGPATASAPLSAAFPEYYPFMDDVVAAQVPGLEMTKFSLKEYVPYAEALQARAAALAQTCDHHPWTAQDAGMALWAGARREVQKRKT
jgi:hypothetical protein